MRRIVLILVLGVAVIGQINGQKIESKKVFGGYEYYQDERPQSIKQLERKMESLPEAYELVQKAKGNNIMATIAGYAGGFLIGWPIGTALAGGEPNWGLAGIGAGALILSIPFASGYSKKMNQAVDIYNSSLENTSYRRPKPSLKFVASARGFGLRMVF